MWPTDWNKRPYRNKYGHHDEDYRSECCSSNETPKVETQKPPLHTYQVVYMDHEAIRRVQILEASLVITEDDDHDEFWNDTALLLKVQKCALISVRNISELDMKNLDS